MKKEKTLTILIIFTAVLVVLSFFKNNFLQVEQKKESKLEAIKFEKIQPPLSTDLTVAQADNDKSSIQIEYKKCFGKDLKNNSFEGAAANLISQKDFSLPQLSEENYELVGSSDQSLAVQYYPQEDNENKVRVFTISSQDGFPDRMKDFPHSHSEVSLRLKGALSMGEIKSKTVSTTQTAYDGSMLSLDKKDNKIIRAHYMTRNFDFECKNQSCACLKKE